MYIEDLETYIENDEKIYETELNSDYVLFHCAKCNMAIKFSDYTCPICGYSVLKIASDLLRREKRMEIRSKYRLSDIKICHITYYHQK